MRKSENQDIIQKNVANACPNVFTLDCAKSCICYLFFCQNYFYSIYPFNYKFFDRKINEIFSLKQQFVLLAHYNQRIKLIIILI